MEEPPEFVEDIEPLQARTPEEFADEQPAFYGEPTTPEEFYNQELQPPGPPPPQFPGAPEGFENPENYPINPTYVPNVPARGFEHYEPNRLASAMGKEEGFIRSRRDRRISPSGVTAASLFTPSHHSFMRESPEALMAGAARIDPKAFVEQVASRERDIVSQAFDQNLLQQFAAKDENAEPLRFSNAAEMERALGPGWVLVHDTFPIRWFPAETEFLNDTINRIQQMREMGIVMTDEKLDNELKALANDHAEEFVRTSFNAQKLDGVAVPENFFEYQKRIVTATDPFDHPAARAYARYIHLWRTLTLAYMPRWAVNTAIGSFLLNMVKGVDPRHYAQAKRLKAAGRFGEPEQAGVELGNITGMDYLEPGMHGIGGDIERYSGVGITPMGEKIVEKVQQIEDYFRRASFVHSLDRVGKQRMQEMGTVIANLEKRRTSPRDDEYIDELMNDPEAVTAALEDLNRFSYNFAALGPYERRYVRMGIPFWGWYKFISKLAYRLPVEYPGRANIMANIGFIGNLSQEEFGQFPEWLRGFVPIGEDKSPLTYMSTGGLNPFAHFFNPLGEQGMVQGALSVGQASPPIQAFLSSLGLDSLRGGVAPISPESGIAPDFFGQWINTQEGRETSPMIEGALRRGIMGLLRAAPQFRMAEERLAEGRPVYPESIPLLDERPMAVRERRDTSELAALGQMFGLWPKRYDLRAYQRLLPERVRYSKARVKTGKRKIKRSDRQR
jgi:hypothetical protein